MAYPVDMKVIELLIGNCLLVILSLVAVYLRTFRQHESIHHFSSDDVFALISSGLGLGLIIIQGIWATQGEGYPLDPSDGNQLMVIKQLLVAFEFLYALVTFTMKFSLLCLYHRLFCDRISGTLKNVVKGVMWFVGLWSIGNILQVFMICQPFEAIYNESVHGTCGDQVASYVAIGCFNIISDVIIFTLPVMAICSLQMPRASKVSLVIVFGLGLSATVVSVVRIYYMAQDLQLDNLTVSMVYPAFWTTLEVHLSILCINVPRLGYVMRDVKKAWSRLAAKRAAAARPSSFPDVPLPNGFRGTPRLGLPRDGPWVEIPIASPTTPGGVRYFPPRPTQTPFSRFEHTSRCEPVAPMPIVVPARGIQVQRDWTVEYLSEEERRALEYRPNWY